MSEAETDRIAEIAAEPGNTIIIAAHQIELTPMTIKQLAPVMRLCDPVMPELQKALSGEGVDLVKLAANHGDRMMELVQVLSNQDAEFVSQLALDDFISLAASVLRVNADFFVQRVRPGLNNAVADLGSVFAKPLIEPTGSPAASD